MNEINGFFKNGFFSALLNRIVFAGRTKRNWQKRNIKKLELFRIKLLNLILIKRQRSIWKEEGNLDTIDMMMVWVCWEKLCNR